jgi:hypothetical protein
MKKYIINYIPVLMLGLFLLISCKKDQNVRMPEMKKGITPYFILGANSDKSIDLNDPAGFHLDLKLDILFPDPFQKLTLVVVRNSDYAHQNIVKDNITSVPQSFSITSSDLTSAIPGLTLSDIKIGDIYSFFVNSTLEDGTVLPGFLSDGSIGYSPVVISSLASLKGANAIVNIDINVPCPFISDSTVGSYH